MRVVRTDTGHALQVRCHIPTLARPVAGSSDRQPSRPNPVIVFRGKWLRRVRQPNLPLLTRVLRAAAWACVIEMGRASKLLACNAARYCGIKGRAGVVETVPGKHTLPQHAWPAPCGSVAGYGTVSYAVGRGDWPDHRGLGASGGARFGQGSGVFVCTAVRAVIAKGRGKEGGGGFASGMGVAPEDGANDALLGPSGCRSVALDLQCQERGEGLLLMFTRRMGACLAPTRRFTVV